MSTKGCLKTHGFNSDTEVDEIDFINEQMQKLADELSKLTNQDIKINPINIKKLIDKYTVSTELSEFDIADSKVVTKFNDSFTEDQLSLELQKENNPFDNTVYFKPVIGDIGVYYSNPNENFSNGNIQEQSKYLLDQNKDNTQEFKPTQDQVIAFYAEAIKNLPCA